jgi:heat shock protein HslJ
MSVLKKCARLTASIFALALAVSIAACGDNAAAPSTTTVESSGQSSAAAAAFVTGAWKLQSLTRPDSTTVTVNQPELFTLEFVEGETRLALRVDCNRAVGPYKTNGSTLTVGAVAMTRAYCAATAAFGDEYMSMLGGENLVTVTATSLVLSSPRGTLRFGK